MQWRNTNDDTEPESIHRSKVRIVTLQNHSKDFEPDELTIPAEVGHDFFS